MIVILTSYKCLLDDFVYKYYENYDFLVLDQTKGHLVTIVYAGLLNARSINNKALFIKDYVVDHQIDILGTTETWTKSDGESNRVVNELSPRDILSSKYREKNDLVVVLACYITQA